MPYKSECSKHLRPYENYIFRSSKYFTNSQKTNCVYKATFIHHKIKISLDYEIQLYK